MDVGFSKCDPYVILNHGPLEKRTSVASGTNPTWKESLAFSMEVPETELQVDRVFFANLCALSFYRPNPMSLGQVTGGLQGLLCYFITELLFLAF